MKEEDSTKVYRLSLPERMLHTYIWINFAIIIISIISICFWALVIYYSIFSRYKSFLFPSNGLWLVILFELLILAGVIYFLFFWVNPANREGIVTGKQIGRAHV